ncbi:hypothetical protein D6T64_18855 [Cryobacterium melibiosiphilum]|uniref:AbiEi antitoxin C-terminal domain-containing protein n=1 Tax=Cryobacterium melibiosiphilum TaxID=995039 RepID=A0A3A5M8U7_9MICO|nr:hypothetical protein [Cryobacterium melibiosiphilum]RJT85671.1 hypothetical protein D6T64_18855 [Cryobacterium melibiosiphilum]
MPANAFFSHQTAAQLLGIPLPARRELALPLHVSVVDPARAPDARDIVGHRLTIEPAEIILWRGLPITGPARTWMDLAAVLDLADLVAAGDYLLSRRHPLTTLTALTDALAHYPGRRGLVTARRALPLLRDGAESRRESLLRVVIVEAGLPEPECNATIYDAHGLFLARGDLVYREYRSLLEYQGDYHRTDRGQWRRDIRRLGTLEDNDWLMQQFTDDDLAAPVELVNRIERRLRARGWSGQRMPRG